MAFQNAACPRIPSDCADSRPATLSSAQSVFHTSSISNFRFQGGGWSRRPAAAGKEGHIRRHAIAIIRWYRHTFLIAGLRRGARRPQAEARLDVRSTIDELRFELSED